MDTSIDKCWAEGYCKGYPSKCNKFCDAYVLLEILYKQSNIPVRYQYFKEELVIEPIDERVYETIGTIKDDIRNWVEKGNNLLLYGDNKGTGKTTLACSLANAYIRERVHDTDFSPVAYFIKSSKFLEEIRLQFNSPDEQFPLKLTTVEKVPLLIIDDIGAEKPSDWVRERLLNIIDERYSNKLSTIYTSNFNLTQLGINLHDRIADRIKDSKLLEFKGVSKRGIRNE